ncbi:hypothetical protein F183_A48500 [Bryobacterales bacterium F-183]|nr:hypothetical protein F183_A48500 [Bryobacterales bacterium F-183]
MLAQNAGTPAPPPTYDYDSAVAGTQGPKAAQVAGYTYRSVRSFQMAVPVFVPLKELQAVLPPGYTPVASPAGSDTATITLNFFLDQRFQPDASSPTTFGPTSAVLITTTVLNSNLATPRQEIVFPGFEASADVDQLNAAFGPGSVRMAKVTAGVTDRRGVKTFKFRIEDKDLGFEMIAQAEIPGNIPNRVVSDPVGLAFRTFNGMTPNKAFWAASQSDAITVPATDTKILLHSPGDRIVFPTGSVSIVRLGATITFNRNLEFILKFEE